MEEARQYPPLTGEQRALAVIYFGGPTILLVAIIFQFMGYDDAVFKGFSIHALTRVVVSMWIALRPAVGSLIARSNLRNAVSGVTWLIVGAFSFWVGWIK